MTCCGMRSDLRRLRRSTGGVYSSGMPDFQTTPELSPERASLSIDPASSSVTELRQAMADGRLTATALTQHFLEQIGELNPSLHAVITVNHDAIAEAGASDEAWESGRPRGPLEGIPVLVKDNVQVAGMPTTAGSPATLPAGMRRVDTAWKQHDGAACLPPSVGGSCTDVRS